MKPINALSAEEVLKKHYDEMPHYGMLYMSWDGLKKHHEHFVKTIVKAMEAYHSQFNQSDWKQLREKFFNECIEEFGSGYAYKKSPNNIFEWFKREVGDYVPGVPAEDSASVASHSCTQSNSIEQIWRDPNDLGGTGHGDISYSDADPGL